MRIDRAAVPRIYALTASVGGLRPSQVVSRLIAAGLTWVQFREKQPDDLELLSELQKLPTVPPDVRIFVNDRVDLALAAQMDGVHLGDRDLPAAAARSIGGERLLIGVSTHSIEQAAAADADAAVDYVAIGPIFVSPTKDVRAPLGLELLRLARAKVTKPLVAIGGIDHSNIGAVLDAGADSAAVISALYRNGEIERNTDRLLAAAGRR